MDVSFDPAGNSRTYGEACVNSLDTHMAELAVVKKPDIRDFQDKVLAVVKFPFEGYLKAACDGDPWPDVQLRMNYEKLMGLGSKTIQDMFTPRAQARFRRHLGFEQSLPEGIEYVLDFTPPSEGPELADLTAALWLPRVVKLWFLAGQYIPDPIVADGIGVQNRPLADKAVGGILTLGHDDVCKGVGCIANYADWQARPLGELPGIVENPVGTRHFPPWRDVEDYCPIRHRAAIVRVLNAINGESLLLNSAVRMWTVAQVAISLEIPQVVVDPVTQWLVAPPNTKFIEICPERAYQLARALKIPSVLTTSFKILVNELAVDYASSRPVTRPPPLTWAQRRRDDYGDHPSDPIEYASRALAERMQQALQLLRSEDFFTRLADPINQWECLRAYGTVIEVLSPDTPLRVVYNDLVKGLVSSFSDLIESALYPESLEQKSIKNPTAMLEAQRDHYVSEAGRQPLFSLYSRLTDHQKLLTPFFWDRLSRFPERRGFTLSHYDGTTLRILAENFNVELTYALRDPEGIADLTEREFVTAMRLVSCATTNRDNVVAALAEFNIDHFYHEFCASVKSFCAQYRPSHNYGNEEHDNPIPLYLSDHLLLSLSEKEMNYLPIWANGLDDGSGGVFQEPVPPAEMGPSEPGPGYHTGYTIPTGTAMTETDPDGGATDNRTVSGVQRYDDVVSTIAPSDLGVGDLRIASSTASASLISGGGGGGKSRTDDWVSATAGRSVDVQHSGTETSTATTSKTTGRSSLATPSEGAFTAGDEEDRMYADARYAQPAAHQAQGQAIEQYVHEVDGESREGGSKKSAGGDSEDDGELVWDSDEMEVDLGLDDEDDDGSSTLDGFEEVDAEVR
ncbi:uncharacterized protein C8A04DRAFT_34722 [Dichotomopilus funicola]|uniref:Uncharacterized protein n=1 Tax=Dichotomopilus funicola TaxID=1934379 RepID=A0AAN6ZPF1_9PEZI|nr:hypothetical protein C8A04DRAFT_34722 [Dichotomopilus funicola]